MLDCEPSRGLLKCVVYSLWPIVCSFYEASASMVIMRFISDPSKLMGLRTAYPTWKPV